MCYFTPTDQLKEHKDVKLLIEINKAKEQRENYQWSKHDRKCNAHDLYNKKHGVI